MMRWYINDVSLQGQFNDVPHFLDLLNELLSCRARIVGLRNAMHLIRTIADRPVAAGCTLRNLLSSTDRTELRRAMLLWLDRKGPFVEDDRQPEIDDYFECKGIDVTNTGLGEATRRVKADMATSTFSFAGGAIEFGEAPLWVDHGIPEDRLGGYKVANIWTLADLASSALDVRPPPGNWEELVTTAREYYPRLLIPDAVFAHSRLAKEPFEATICERALTLLKYLDEYMAGRTKDGAEGPVARAIIEKFFTGDRALFSGESPSNQTKFKTQMTFPDPEDGTKEIFAHWHGKISHRYFRLHFEWPVPQGATRLKVLYLGPKLTKQ